MNWKRWKLGLMVATCQALFVAGATAFVDDWNIRAFVVAFCTSIGFLWGNFLKEHPVDQITDTTQIKKSDEN